MEASESFAATTWLVLQGPTPRSLPVPAGNVPCKYKLSAPTLRLAFLAGDLVDRVTSHAQPGRPAEATGRGLPWTAPSLLSIYFKVGSPLMSAFAARILPGGSEQPV